jgi:hypothetical protein
MRGLFFPFPHRSPILLVGLLVFSTHLLWAQRTSPLGKIPLQRLHTPAPFARVSESQTRLHLTFRRLPLTFDQNQGQTELRMRFFDHYSGYYRPPTNAALYSATRTAELWGKEKYSIGRAPKWPKFAPTHVDVLHETTYRVGDLEHYGSNIPWAGSIILRICQQANAHPHVMRLLKVLKPRF